MARSRRSSVVPWRLNVQPDTVDFRDRMYQPTLVEVPTTIRLADYRRWRVPILDQGNEGSCTGFGLATVVHYLLRRRSVYPSRTRVSPRMLYEMAKKYDEWPGEHYEGSSARGGMKGWHKHGVCSESRWRYTAKEGHRLTAARARDAATRPLGAYLRVNHKDLIAMHSALAEVGILYATSTVHSGWLKPDKRGAIPDTGDPIGGHAFAIVAFDAEGFWIQNSWGPTWGLRGLARVSYERWLRDGTDVWVARLGAPVARLTPDAAATSVSAAAGAVQVYAVNDLRPHIVSLGNDGALRTTGTYGTSAADVHTIITQDFVDVTKTWQRKRLLLYAHGGLVPEQAAVQRVADYRRPMLEAEVYPLAFVWKSDYWSTLTDLLEDIIKRRRPEGILGAAKDFLLDRLDDTLEVVARVATGKAEWDEMKENAERATTTASGGARVAARFIAELKARVPDLEVHIAGHSAGSIFHAPLVQLLTGSGPDGLDQRIATCTLWAPAVTVGRFKETYLPAITHGRITQFGLFTLTDEAEQDDNCGHVYHKSLLYLVSNAFEGARGTPILGMERFVRADPALAQLLEEGRSWVLSPNTVMVGQPGGARARHHGDFDDDQATLRATLARITAASAVREGFTIHRSASGLRDRARGLAAAT